MWLAVMDGSFCYIPVCADYYLNERSEKTLKHSL